MKLESRAYQTIIDNLHEGLYLVDRNRVITFWNKAAERISGYAASEVVGRSCADSILTHVDAAGNQLCCGLCPLAATIEDQQQRESEIFMHHKQGHRVPVAVRVSSLTDDDGNCIGGVELFTDLSNQVAHALRVEELEKLALLDSLTQLANRHFVERSLDSNLAEAKRLQLPVGVLFMDIDHFKAFNDKHGHALGDDVLKFVANTFTANARAFDLYGRWGGEEFIGVIRNTDVNALEEVGNRMRALIANAYIMHEGDPLRVTMSVGATAARPADTLTSLVARADALMYTSKSAGRNCLTLG
jgi:diguanylate cyclase (GGDEF)-like protein/PAS domain S-box-containing protein